MSNFCANSIGGAMGRFSLVKPYISSHSAKETHVKMAVEVSSFFTKC